MKLKLKLKLKIKWEGRKKKIMNGKDNELKTKKMHRKQSETEQQSNEMRNTVWVTECGGWRRRKHWEIEVLILRDVCTTTQHNRKPDMSTKHRGRKNK